MFENTGRFGWIPLEQSDRPKPADFRVRSPDSLDCCNDQPSRNSSAIRFRKHWTFRYQANSSSLAASYPVKVDLVPSATTTTYTSSSQCWLPSTQPILSSTNSNGGPNKSHLPSATISSPTTKRARLSAPEVDGDCLRGAVMVDSVKNAIWNALNHYAYEDAVFIAERWHAEKNSDETAFLLATCLYRSGDKHRAHEILSRCHPEQASPDIRYLFGKICCDLESYDKAESVLANSSVFAKPYDIEDLENFYKPDTLPFALQLLGVVHQKSQRRELAAVALKRAVSLNPFQWTSFESLCRMKEPVDARETFFRAVSASKSCQSLDGHSEDDESQNDASQAVDDIDMAPVEEDSVNRSGAVTPVITPAVPVTSPVKSILTRKSVTKPAERPSVGTAKSRMRSIAEEPSSGIISSVTAPTMPPGSTSFRTTNSYPSPQSSNSQLNISDMPSVRNSLAAKKTKSKPPFRPAALTNATPDSSSLRNRRMSETSLTSSSSSSSQPPPLRRSTRILANKVGGSGSAVKENKTLKKHDDFDNNIKLNRKMGSQEENLNMKLDTAMEFAERCENGTVIRKPSIIDLTKKEPTIIRQKRKKEPVLPVLPKPAPEPVPVEVVLTEQEKTTSLVMRAYYRFGEVVQSLHSYDVQAAMAKLGDLSVEQQETPFYWYLKGKLHFEVLEYDKSVAAFAEMRRKDAYFIKGIDYYSVALWHLQKEKDLAVLAKYLIEHHRTAPETYIVYGNVFSLQREHETAIKMFRRALQLSPNYAYALTLLGHEYISLEEMDKAVQCFRLAISADPAHYNGWYGLGLVAYKQENYSSALASFKRALSVYPTNPIILVNLAISQHALKQSVEALRTLTSAVNGFPNNPLCRFQKASLLYSMGRLEDAMNELNTLKDMVPKESLVYFLMGKVSKRTDNTHMALMYFSKAMDLDPKGTNNQIKETFNKLYGGVEDDVVPQRAASGTTSATTSYASEL